MDTNLNLSIVVAYGQRGGIGKDGELLPWKLKADMKRFVELTKGHVVIVGRKTYESILKRLGHPLTGRKTIVLTRNLRKLTDYAFASMEWEDVAVMMVDSWKEALQAARALAPEDEIFVIGGAEIYKLALPYAKTLYITCVRADFEADAFFPSINHKEWEELQYTYHSSDRENSYDFDFITLTRKSEPQKTFVNLGHARVTEQRQVMEEISEEELCPFCPKNLSRFHRRPILSETIHWILTENQWPYENTRVHLLAIYKTHAESVGQIEPEAGEELIRLAQWVERQYNLEGGTLAIGMRFGDTEATGATVRHIHAQFVSARITDKSDPDYKPVRFRAG